MKIKIKPPPIVIHLVGLAWTGPIVKRNLYFCLGIFYLDMIHHVFHQRLPWAQKHSTKNTQKGRNKNRRIHGTIVYLPTWLVDFYGQRMAKMPRWIVLGNLHVFPSKRAVPASARIKGSNKSQWRLRLRNWSPRFFGNWSWKTPYRHQSSKDIHWWLDFNIRI